MTVSLSLVTGMYYRKTAGPIEMPFGVWDVVYWLALIAVNQWQPGPFAKLLWPLAKCLKAFRGFLSFEVF